VEKIVAGLPGDCVLNVAGSRGSKAPGLQAAVCRILVDVLIRVNPACKSLYPLADPDPRRN